ncbi:unnamed protein product [Rotaria sordida]|uniref:Uncharacterized protein n=1 Tax=Rotaria sordida TaxID=392033 RepID=A0A814PZP0_9BILA|nr:unnamed protein product [Rotaria sordida]
MNLRFCAYLNHVDYQLLFDSLDKLRETAKKLNEPREKPEKHLSIFNIAEFLAAHRNYIEKFQAIELSQELTTTRTHLTRFLFSECLELYMFSWNIKHLSLLIQTSLENSDIDSGWRSTSCQNLLDLALKRLFESFPFYFLIN